MRGKLHRLGKHKKPPPAHPQNKQSSSPQHHRTTHQRTSRAPERLIQPDIQHQSSHVHNSLVWLLPHSQTAPHHSKNRFRRSRHRTPPRIRHPHRRSHRRQPHRPHPKDRRQLPREPLSRRSAEPNPHNPLINTTHQHPGTPAHTPERKHHKHPGPTPEKDQPTPLLFCQTP